MAAFIPKTVFISYRRTNQAHAIKLYQLLREMGYDPFLDIKNLGSGAWRVLIQQEIQRRAHFVLLLTPSAVQRLTEPNDVLRFEIETALDNKRNIVPLTFEGFSYSDPRIHDYLTGKLAILDEYNAYPINWRRLKKDIQDLIARFLSVHPDEVVHPSDLLAEEAEASLKLATDDFSGAMPKPVMIPTAPLSQKKSASSAGGLILAILTSPVWLIYKAYQLLSQWISPNKTDIPRAKAPEKASPPPPREEASTERQRESAPPPRPAPAIAPAPAPMPQAPGAMNEVAVFQEMYQLLAELPPVDDDALASEAEAEG